MSQHGYALLMSLFILMGLSGVWLSGTVLNHSTNSADQTLELSLARTALISYAVNYIDHYGPQGAGIGRLPCPDTDHPIAGESDPWHRDGPNPPCAKKAVEFGWLPRHVNVRDGRYHFHARARQRLLYAVSGKFVNNPLGRIVNASTDGDMSFGQFNDVVAVLSVPTLDVDHGMKRWDSVADMLDNSLAYALVRSSDIRAQAVQRVGGWLAWQLNNAQSQRCQEINTQPECGFAARALLPCDMTIELKLYHWLSLHPISEDCDGYLAFLETSFNLLENAPRNRHWFMRNEWFRNMELGFDDDCLQQQVIVCRFNSLPVISDKPMLQLQLQLPTALAI